MTLDANILAADFGASDLVDLQVKIEMRAVWKIKFRFGKWLEEAVTNVV
jgi:hypothetical protein